MEKTGCKIICGAPTTLSVKELMIMMMEWKDSTASFCNLTYITFCVMETGKVL